jgi:hypothetical protein
MSAVRGERLQQTMALRSPPAPGAAVIDERDAAARARAGAG